MTKDKMYQLIMSLLTAGLIGAFSWAWNLNAEIAVIKNNMLTDDSSKENANHVLQTYNSTVTSVESHARQLKNLWKHLNAAQEKEIHWEGRVSRLEVKQEICCD